MRGINKFRLPTYGEGGIVCITHVVAELLCFENGFHPAILLPSVGRLIVGNGFLETVPSGLDLRLTYPVLLDEDVRDGFGAALG